MFAPVYPETCHAVWIALSPLAKMHGVTLPIAVLPISATCFALWLGSHSFCRAAYGCKECAILRVGMGGP